MYVLYFCCFSIVFLMGSNGIQLLKPIDCNHPPMASIESTSYIEPNMFFENHVMENKPVLLKNFLYGTKSYDLWSDEYLQKRFRSEKVSVDFQKYENRSGVSREMTLGEFLETYQHPFYPSRYLISPLPLLMQKEFSLPTCLMCKEIINRLQDFVLWFSSGNTNSHLHFDNVENLYCQIDGAKDWFLVDPWNGSSHIAMDHPEGQYSGVNVTAVDFDKYPTLKNVPWWKAVTTPGDCIYVPFNWWHQVRSFNGRNLAVNIWWAPTLHHKLFPYFFGCQVLSENLFLSDLKLSPGEWVKWRLAVFILENAGEVTYLKMHKNIVHEHTKKKLISLSEFKTLDKNRDGVLKINEFLEASPAVVHASVQYAEIGAINTNGDDEE